VTALRAAAWSLIRPLELDISERIWSDVAVTDDALRFQVSELRKAFGADGEAFIRTVPREGYRWEAPVRKETLHRFEWGYRERGDTEGEVRHRLILASRDRAFRERKRHKKGSERFLWIDHTAVSRRHARIVFSSGGATLEDLGSKNGTDLKGERTHNPVPLHDGEEIRIGPVAMTFRVLSRVGTTETEEKGRGKAGKSGFSGSRRRALGGAGPTANSDYDSMIDHKNVRYNRAGGRSWRTRWFPRSFRLSSRRRSGATSG
jgi:hypothetical protein